MKLVDKLIVVYRDHTVGALSIAPDSRLCAFQYNEDWLANGFYAVGESIRIPRKKGKIMILSIAEGCSEILSKDYASTLTMG